MPFSQASISDVRVVADGPELFVSWTSTAIRSIHQVYVNWQLAWSGQSRRCYVPRPAVPEGGVIWVHVGVVAPQEATSDFSAALTAATGLTSKARLTWKGGTYLDATGLDDVRGFRIFASGAAGGPVDFTTPVGTVCAYPGGWVSDGFGLGGFGEGGFGRSATLYTWESENLASGLWQFGVVPYDSAGNIRGVGQTATVAIAQAPRPPAAMADGSRLAAQYSGPQTSLLTLTWLPSPP